MLCFSGKPSEIIPEQLYLGSISSSRRLTDIQTMNIGAIVNCTCEIPNYFENSGEHSLKYMKLELDDSVNQNIAKHFESTFEFISNSIENEGKAVLVHCAAGISRSSTIVIAYVMRKQDISLRDAFINVRKCRSVVMPNSGFFKQLIEYEKKLRGSQSLDEKQYNELAFIGNPLFNLYA